MVAAQVKEPVNKDQSTNPSTRMGYCGIRPGRADVQIETPGFTDFGSRFKRREHTDQPFGHTQRPNSAAMHSRQTFEKQQQVQRPQSAAIHRQPRFGIRMGFTTLRGMAVLWPGQQVHAKYVSASSIGFRMSTSEYGCQVHVIQRLPLAKTM